MKELIKRLTAEFEHQDYAHAYMEDNLVTRLAAQVFTLRKQRGWSQQELSKRSGVAQERISKIESGDFDSLTMSTLHKFSRAFDVNLSIRFSEFSKGLLDIANLNQDLLRVISRQEDIERLNSLQVKVDSNGKWRHVDKDKVYELITFSQPSTANGMTELNRWTPVASSAKTSGASLTKQNIVSIES